MSAKKLFVIVPHPDDESFVPGGTIAKYGHTESCEVFLYTLTKGEASRNAKLLSITNEEMGNRREQEVRDAARILGVKGHYQSAYPDAGLRDLDPRILEREISEKILLIEPHVLLTYDVQGTSAHPDHIVVHHVVKRCFLSLREQVPSLRRLAFFNVTDKTVQHFPRKLFGFPPERIHAIIDVAIWLALKKQAIDVQVSVRRDVEEQNFENWLFAPFEYFSFFRESYSPPVHDLFTGIES